MNDPWMEWENSPKAIALLGHYVACEGPAQPRREAEAWMAFSQAEKAPLEPDRHTWEITEHATLIALGYLDLVSTESSPRGKPMGYKITVPGLAKAAYWTNQDSVVDSDNG